MVLDLPEGQWESYPATPAGLKPCAKPDRPDIVCASRTSDLSGRSFSGIRCLCGEKILLRIRHCNYE